MTYNTSPSYHIHFLPLPNMHSMPNPGLETVIAEMSRKLNKLNLLDSALDRLTAIETKIDTFESDISRLKHDRGMMNNLIFTGIAESIDLDSENCEHVLKRFIHEELDISKGLTFRKKNETNVGTIIENINKIQETNNKIENDRIINSAIKEINNIFNNSAKEAFSKPKPFKYYSQKTTSNNQWFDSSCRSSKKLFHKAKRKYKNQKSAINKSELNSAGKIYRSDLNRAHNKLEFQTEHKIRELSKNNAKSFWKILEEIDGKTKYNADSNIDELYDYFKDLNTIENPNDIEFNISLNGTNNELIDEILNAPITNLEILRFY
ncbi:hypothetical protein LOTGIDRAFT_165308 [Lottia gigantea]|uniref:Uncharacterized protein n=1 Tax=Lottia gigantea TaxID=225164 RepID=V4A1W4_LOTGI|nr:hypothetical protein LOTGIDRAFT_165308 [Lottia gigantea]ESO88890.1 hypothetical protein LOTGIDRAFT_165308 [Lottia gigantea]